MHRKESVRSTFQHDTGSNVGYNVYPAASVSLKLIPMFNQHVCTSTLEPMFGTWCSIYLERVLPLNREPSRYRPSPCNLGSDPPLSRVPFV